MFNFGSRSNEQLATVEERLQRVMRRAISISKVDFSILEGRRTQERQYELYAQGRTVAELRNAGVPLRILARPGEPKVTWTLHSKHFPPAPGALGRAVDTGVYPYDPKAGPAEYKPIYDAVMEAARLEGVKIRSGMDWDQDGHLCESGETDLGHFELVN